MSLQNAVRRQRKARWRGALFFCTDTTDSLLRLGSRRLEQPGDSLLEQNETRNERLEHIRRLIESGRLNPDAGDFRCLRLSDEEEQLLSWLHCPNPTEPVLVEHCGRTLPTVKFALEHGIFAVYVMEYGEDSAISESLAFAGLYDPKAIMLYTDGACDAFDDVPFASSEDLEQNFLDAAAFAFESMTEPVQGAPEHLEGTARAVWDVFLRAYPAVVHEAFIFGGEPEDVLRLYTSVLMEELAPEWTRDVAAMFLGDQEELITTFLASIPREAFELGACVCDSLYSYWQHIGEHSEHPAHRLRTISNACTRAHGEFVQMDLVNAELGKSGTITFPKGFLADGAFGAFDTRGWPDAVRAELKELFPDSYGCFRVSNISSLRELFTGKLLYRAPQDEPVYSGVWDNPSGDPGGNGFAPSSY